MSGQSIRRLEEEMSSLENPEREGNTKPGAEGKRHKETSLQYRKQNELHASVIVGLEIFISPPRRYFVAMRSSQSR